MSASAASLLPKETLSRLRAAAATGGTILPSSGLGAHLPGDREPLLPVRPELAGLLPAGGLRRGAVHAVHDSTALLFALVGPASAAGAWCALVGLPDAGLLAAADAGIDLTRLALVPEPGPDWPTVVAALIDALDVVVLAPPAAPPAAVPRRLAARARERGAVLVVRGDWPGAEVGLRVVRTGWEGLGNGRGRLRGCRLEVESRGRGGAARPRRTVLHLTDPAAPPPAGAGAPGRPGRGAAA